MTSIAASMPNISVPFVIENNGRYSINPDWYKFLFSFTQYVVPLADTTSGNILVSNGVSFVSVVMSGAATIDSTGTLSLAASGVTANTYGTASSVGTYIVNNKGLITAASNTPIQITESQVTSLTTDLATKLVKANNLSDVISVPTARSNLNLDIGFDVYLGTETGVVTGDGTEYVIICNTAIANVGSAYSTSTGKFTAPYAGFYQFNSIVDFDALGAAHTLLQIVFRKEVSSTVNYQTAYENPQGSLTSTVLTKNGSQTVYLAALDTVKIVATVSNSTKTVKVNTNTRFSGKFLG